MQLEEKQSLVRTYYRTLSDAWGPQNWWPAASPFEVIVGAYLTQNTAWTNVEKAMANLRSAKALSVNGIRRLSLTELERLIRPSGYFRQKAQRLKIFVDFLDRKYGSSLAKLFARPTALLREELLALNGVGPETADAILLYSGNHPVFVVDAYTRRILARHEILPAETPYEDVRRLVEEALAPLAEIVQKPGILSSAPSASAVPPAPHPPTIMSASNRTALPQIYNEMHGLIVGVGKGFCRKSQPLCDGCPLQPFLPRLK